jgi:hypothetical protein
VRLQEHDAAHYAWERTNTKEGTMAELKTDEKLLKALHAAASRKVSPEEMREQRVSYIMGMFKPDSDITRERVLDVLAEQSGIR